MSIRKGTENRKLGGVKFRRRWLPQLEFKELIILARIGFVQLNSKLDI